MPSGQAGIICRKKLAISSLTAQNSLYCLSCVSFWHLYHLPLRNIGKSNFDLRVSIELFQLCNNQLCDIGHKRNNNGISKLSICLRIRNRDFEAVGEKDKAYEKELEKCTAVHRPHH